MGETPRTMDLVEFQELIRNSTREGQEKGLFSKEALQVSSADPRPPGMSNLSLLDQGMADLQIVTGIEAMPIEITTMLVVFSFLFVIGFTGNLTVIIRILKDPKLFLHPYGKEGNRRMTTQRYVLFLACVDLFVTSTIPLLMPYFYSGQWLIGKFMCKFIWAAENVNKILSIHILTAMAIERYFIVLNSVRTGRGRMPRIATSMWFLGTIISVILLSPLILFVDLDVMLIGDTTVTTCVSPMPDQVFISFLTYMFVCSFCVPALVVSFCYIGLVRILKTRYTSLALQHKESTKTHLIQKVSKSILCVTAFHFACWTPFWILSFVPFVDKNLLPSTRPEFMMIMQLIPVVLPYVNCSFNWCFYVLLNKRLRKQIFRSSTSYASVVVKYQPTGQGKSTL